MIIELHLGRIVRKNSSSLDRKNFRLDFTYIPTKSIFFFNRKIQYITKKLVYKVDVQRHTQEIPEPHQRKKKKQQKLRKKHLKAIVPLQRRRTPQKHQAIGPQTLTRDHPTEGGKREGQRQRGGRES